MSKPKDILPIKTSISILPDEKELLDKICSKNRDNQSKTIGIAIRLLAKKEGIV